MNVTFHLASAIGLGHAASRYVRTPDFSGWYGPGDATLLAPVFALGIFSHGILDGLWHQYPVPMRLDPLLSLILFLLWNAFIQRRFRLLLGVAFLGAILPDLVDLGPAIAGQFGLHLPNLSRLLGLHLPAAHLFPWHWPQGSGSIFDGSRRFVSLTNHFIVICFSAVAVWANRGIFKRSHLRLD
jgi:hypothetical protein